MINQVQKSLNVWTSLQKIKERCDILGFKYQTLSIARDGEGQKPRVANLINEYNELVDEYNLIKFDWMRPMNHLYHKR